MEKTVFFQNKCVVVTGGAGFIGSHLCEALVDLGAHVIAVDNLVTGKRKNISHILDKIHYIEADVTLPPETYLPNELHPDIIFHFASLASPPLYQAKPIETYLVNSIGTHFLLQYLLHKNPSARFIFASTSEVYGDPQEHPQTESYWGNVNPNGLRSCYDESKRMGETVCGVHTRSFDMNVRIVRIFNTYGPRMSPTDGRIIPNFIMQALRKENLTLFGTGTQTRTFCYVSDLVSGILLLAEKDAARGETINIGNPKAFSALETAEIIQKEVLGEHGKEFIFKELPSDDPVRRQPNIEKAKRILDWSPSIEFAEGLKKTVEYFQELV